MAKNQSLPAHLQEKDSRGEDNLTMYEHHEKPIDFGYGLMGQVSVLERLTLYVDEGQ